MKNRNIIITIFFVLAIVVIICSAWLGAFWWNVLRDPSRPDFATPIGQFVSGPDAQVEDSTIVINWSTTDEYMVHGIYLKKSDEKFASLVGDDVTMQYDSTAQLYHYSAEFVLGLPPLQEDGYPQYIHPGDYTYQVSSNTADSSKKIVSPILDLHI